MSISVGWETYPTLVEVFAWGRRRPSAGSRFRRRPAPMSVKVVSPRMLLEFARAPEDVLVTTSSGWSGCTPACPSCSGRTRWSPWSRATTATSAEPAMPSSRSSSVGSPALRRRLRGQQPTRPGVPDPNAQRSGGEDHRRLVAGGHAADLAAHPPAAAPARGVPLFVCAGQLIPQKGTDLVIRAWRSTGGGSAPASCGSSATAPNGSPWSSSAVGWASRTR